MANCLSLLPLIVIVIRPPYLAALRFVYVARAGYSDDSQQTAAMDRRFRSYANAEPILNHHRSKLRKYISLLWYTATVGRYRKGLNKAVAKVVSGGRRPGNVWYERGVAPGPQFEL